MGLVDPGTGIWYLQADDGSASSFYFGNPGDFPFMGDWDCDGTDTPGLYRQADGFVYLRNSNTQGIGEIRFFFGNPGDIPIAGDFNNDGCDTVAIYRPSEGRAFIINELGENEGGLGFAEYNFYFGNPGDKPFVGDFDGDGTDTLGLHRESTGFLYFRNTNTQGIADFQFYFGDPGDRMIAGDWTGDGNDSPGIFRPGDSTFYLRYTNTQGNADETRTWGGTAWLPVAGVFGLGNGSPPPPAPGCGFTEFTLSGSGPAVPSVAAVAGHPAIIHATYNSGSNFIVWSLDGSLDKVDLLVNEIGTYDGRRPINHTPSDSGVQYLEVSNASGPWQIDVIPFCQMRTMSGSSISGTGEDVVAVNRSGIATLTHNGSSNFIIWSHQGYGSGDRDLEVNEIGPFNGDVVMDSGTLFLDIVADGAWSVTYK